MVDVGECVVTSTIVDWEFVWGCREFFIDQDLECHCAVNIIHGTQ